MNGIDLTVDRGEIVALVGESGSGKSMTARAVLGLLPASARATGSITVDGREVLNVDESELNAVRGGRVGMVFQEPQTALNPVRTVGWQLTEALRAHTDLSRKQARTPSRRAARTGRDTRPGHPRALLPPPALGWSEAAGGAGAGPGERPGPAAGRRAHHGARRHRAGGDPRAAPRAEPADRHEHSADHAQHGRGGRDGPPRRRAQERGPRRGGWRTRHLRLPAPPLHPPAPRGRPASA